MSRRLPLGLSMGFVGLFALGFAAMRSGSDLAQQGMYSAMIAVLVVGLLGAIVRRGEPSWVGLTVFGWAYFSFAFLHDITDVPMVETDEYTIRPTLISSHILARLIVKIHPKPDPRKILPPHSELSIRDLPFSNDGKFTPRSLTVESSRSEALIAADRLSNARLNGYRVGESMLTLLAGLAGSIAGPLLAVPRKRSLQEPSTPG